jgi:hypothetical protein
VLEGSPRWEAETSLAHLLFSALWIRWGV